MKPITAITLRIPRRGLRTLVAAGTAALMVTAAACGSTGYSSSSTSSPSAAATQPSSGSNASLSVKQLPSVGAVLTSPTGMTLYTFKKDANGQSNCTGACAQTWPPMTTTASSAPTVSGATGSFSLVKRADGSSQVAYNGAPLYTYSGDKKPGDDNGQGIGGVWFVASAGAGAVSGSPAAGSSPSSSTSTSSAGSYSGY